MEENDFQWEEDGDYFAELYHRGKLIYQKLNALDADDVFERDLFFEDLSPPDEAALKYYNDKLIDKTPHIPDSTELSKSSDTNDTSSFKLSE